MASNVPIHDDFVQDGGMYLLVEDKTTGVMTQVGRCNGIGLSVNTDKAKAQKLLRGMMEDYNERVRGRSAMLKFSQIEWNADAAQFFFGDSDTTQSVEDETRLVPRHYRHRFYDEALQPVPPDVGWGTDGNLDPLTAAAFTQVATSGGGATTAWTVAAYSAWAVPLYFSPDGTPLTIASGTNSGTFFAGRNNPTKFAPGAVKAGGSASIGNVNSTAQLAVTQRALRDDEARPDYWAVFVGLTSGGLAGAKLNMTILNSLTRSGGTQNISVPENSHGSSELYAGSKKACLRPESDWDTGVVTYGAALVEGTDYAYDDETGFLSRVDGGAISNGEMVDITVWVLEPPYVQNDIGRGRRNSDFRNVEVWSMNPDNETPIGQNSLESGFMYRLERVNTAGLAVSLNENEGDFMAPVDAECTALLSANQRFGYHRHFNVRHANFGQGLS